MTMDVFFGTIVSNDESEKQRGALRRLFWTSKNYDPMKPEWLFSLPIEQPCEGRVFRDMNRAPRL